MAYSPENGARDQRIRSAALFVDYEDLYRKLGRLADDKSARIELVSEMIRTLRSHLLEDRCLRISMARAYADFAFLDGAGSAAQNALYLQGIDTRFVPDTYRDNAAELQLCVDAMELLHGPHPDDSTFVLLTGQRIYLPIVQAFMRRSRNILVASVDAPRTRGDAFPLGDDWFLPVGNLLNIPARTRAVPPPQPERRPRISFTAENLAEIEDDILVRTLDIIHRYFGQYEEVYLTPLLRKLSDLVDERRYDPKNLVSELERHKAVRLEKRSGFPHDYTVLILDDRHPTVARILSDGRSRAPYDYGAASDDHEDGFPQEAENEYEYDDRFDYDEDNDYGGSGYDEDVNVGDYDERDATV